jgi:putative MATE family efflux protein
MAHPSTIDLTTGSIPHHLAKLSIPMVWGILSIVSMQVVDAYYVAKTGQIALEAISFTFPVTGILFNLVMGLSIATSSICSRFIGAGQVDNLKQFMAHVIMLSGIYILGLAAVGEWVMPSIFAQMGASEAHMPYILSFMRISLWGYIFLAIPFVVNASLRAAGDSLIPSFIMLTVSLINIPLAGVLVLGIGSFEGWGIAGAATANVISNGIGAIAALYILIVHKKMLDRAHLTLTGVGLSAKRLFSIALPVGITNMIVPLASAVITSFLALSGASAVAAYGIISRIEGLASVILMAIAIGMGPLIGQNFGAKKMDRVEKTISVGISFCLAWSFMTGALLMGFGDQVAQLFTQDPETIHITHTYFMIIGLSAGIANIAIGWSTAWNAMGRPRYSALISIVRYGLCVIACAYIGHMIGGWNGLFTGLLIGNLISGIILHIYSKRILQTLKKEQGD